jgi:hypothetical protein
MRHNLTAVFNNRSDAQHVLDELLLAGYPHSGIALVSPPEPVGAGHAFVPGLGGALKRGLARLFGASHRAPERVDESGFLPGRHIITVTAAAEPDSMRAIGIIERFTPLYVEDRHQPAHPLSPDTPASPTQPHPP